MARKKGEPPRKKQRSEVSPGGRKNSAPPAKGEESDFPVVGVGASAGGLEAFLALLGAVPASSGMAFVLVQHLDPTHDSHLGDAIRRVTQIPVDEARDGMVVEPDHIYLIPPNGDLSLERNALRVLPRSPDTSKPHLPIDLFFSALALEKGRRAIGVVLSGTGSDGVAGLGAIRANSGVTIVQDPQEARFPGMPEAALRAGVADRSLRLEELVGELLLLSRHPHLRATSAEGGGPPCDGAELRGVLSVLRSNVGADFSEYKPATIKRRLARRMALRGLTDLAEYLRVLREEPDEARALLDDLLINVTSFFREGEVFEKIKSILLPKIARAKKGGGSVRIWIPGCSTGEEAYSIAICVLESLDPTEKNLTVQIFGTDISEKAIEKARLGVYPETIATSVGVKRLKRFFTRFEGGYRVNKSVRELCAFVRHDLALDPPFSKIDLISCRNVLIYFGLQLQRRVLANFHFGLNRPGFLVIGRTEGLLEAAKLFEAVDQETKIFARTTVKSTLRLALAGRPATYPRLQHLAAPISAPIDLVRRVESLLLDQYAPPGVIVNQRMEILHFLGRTGPYLEPSPGQPQHDLLKMARPGLIGDLRSAIDEARDTGLTVRRDGVRVRQDGGHRTCRLVVIPHGARSDPSQRVMAVLFEDAPARKELDAAQSVDVARPADAAAEDPRGVGTRESRLRDELKATRDYLESVVQEQQRTNDELAAANEELLSSNEELQSLNEELETTREEVQSTNEELISLNDELQARNSEIRSVNNDLVNIMGSVEVAMVIVDAACRIRSFTPNARSILNLLPADVGRPIGDLRPAISVPDLERQCTEVIERVAMMEAEVRDGANRWYRLQIRPYLSTDKRIEGAVVSIVDIDDLKRSLGAAEWARDYAQSVVQAVPFPLVVLEENCAVVSANKAFLEASRVVEADTVGRSFFELMGGAWGTPSIRSALLDVFESQAPFKVEAEISIPGLGSRTLHVSGRPVRAPGGAAMGLVAIDDITERRHADAERARLLAEAEEAKGKAEAANRAKDVFLATLSHELRTPLTSLLLQSQLLRRTKVLDAERLHRSCEMIEHAAQAQARLIDDLLDISRIVTGKLALSRRSVSLGSVVRTALDAVRDTAHSKGVTLTVDVGEAIVFGDPMRLQQIVWNLLSNAISFTPANGEVRVTLRVANGYAHLQIKDNGAGIDPAFLSRVFQRFSQEDRTLRGANGGLGLGLAIVGHLVEAHRGSVRAESCGKGQGSTFTVSLPISRTELPDNGPLGEGAEPEELRSRGLDGIRVLIVEDDLSTRNAVAEMLRLRGAVVQVAESAAEAMPMFEAHPPDVLVCDISMPGEDGYGFLRRIRARGPKLGGEVPALAMTALAREDDHQQILASGFQKHLTKPVHIDLLVSAVEELVR